MRTAEVDLERIEEVAARLDLRRPNREALESLAGELALHYGDEHPSGPFECVIDSATGVGKTYVLAAGIEYLAGADAVRNFAVIAPGRTIRDKTIANFTSGHPKSLLPNMETHPVVVTADNFDTPAVRAAMDDDAQVKLYVFTVQSILAPTTKVARRTHDYQEGLGAGFYTHLSSLDDLVVFADEHHCYYGEKFSAAVRGLEPYAIVGLTATPDPKTPPAQVIYRYPLAAAIAERWVKTPVIVGRRDDRSDSEAKLADGLALLGYKAKQAANYCAEHGLPPLHPVMLVIAGSTAEADEYSALLRSEELGALPGDSVLVVHSNLKGDAKEKALADLDAVEEPDSPVRVIISVGMLKEGWDVRNVYVICAMRALASKILTEQTLGRGLRLPWGAYTGIELLDTVEVVAHERYEDLLRRADVLNEAFIDQYTRAELRRSASGVEVVRRTDDFCASPLPATETGPQAGSSPDPERAATLELTPTDVRAGAAETATAGLTLVSVFNPREGMTPIEVPIMRMTEVQAQFSLNDIIDLEPYRRLGHSLATDPETQLQRTRVGAEVIVGADGMRHTELRRVAAGDHLDAPLSLLPLDTLIADLTDALLSCPVVPNRPDQPKAAEPIVNAFLDGLGPNAAARLSAYASRAAARLVALVTEEHRKVMFEPRMEEVIEMRVIGGPRSSARVINDDRGGRFAKSVAYDSWAKSVYHADWFDSRPERQVAIIADDAAEVRCWMRLQVGELPILWRSDGRSYNADLIVVEQDGTSWVVEVKADDAISSGDVQAKRRAAKRWVNTVNSSGQANAPWGYLLVCETDIDDAKHSWGALKTIGS